MGAIFFFTVFGYRIVIPTNIDWLTSGDLAQHFSGWNFFRYEAWHFPIGRIEGFGTPDGSSIVFTDSIPIMSIGFKLFRSVLPQPFQFIGLWLLTCYLLQGFFGWLLASLVTNKAYPRILITCFFLLSPPMLFRATGHEALTAHWLILAALYLSVQSALSFELRHPRLSWLKCWTALVLLSGLVHLYLCFMVALLYLGACTSRIFSMTHWKVRTFLALLTPLLALFPVLYMEGAFVVSTANWAGGSGDFNYFSMNLLAPFAPGYTGSPQGTSYDSLFVSPVALAAGGQYEGNNYLGFGVLLLLFLTLVGRLISIFGCPNRGRQSNVFDRRLIQVWLPLSMVTLVLTMIAASNHVSLGKTVLFTIPLSSSMLRYCEIFRSSGRFFWPTYYLILWMTIRSCRTLFSRNVAIFSGIVHAALTFQAVDLTQYLQHYATIFHSVSAYKSPLQSSFWRRALTHYHNILYFPPEDTSYYIPLGLESAPLQVGINVAYKARSDPKVVAREHRQIDGELNRGELRDGALYVFKDKDYFDRLKASMAGKTCLLREVDGFYVAGLVPVQF